LFDTKNIDLAMNELRRIIFRYGFTDEACALLMFCEFLREFQPLLAVNPEKYDNEIRPKAWK